MHIEKNQDGYYWVTDFMRLPLAADTRTQAVQIVSELARSDFFRDRVHVGEVISSDIDMHLQSDDGSEMNIAGLTRSGECSELE